MARVSERDIVFGVERMVLEKKHIKEELIMTIEQNIAEMLQKNS